MLLSPRLIGSALFRLNKQRAIIYIVGPLEPEILVLLRYTCGSLTTKTNVYPKYTQSWGMILNILRNSGNHECEHNSSNITKVQQLPKMPSKLHGRPVTPLLALLYRLVLDGVRGVVRVVFDVARYHNLYAAPAGAHARAHEVQRVARRRRSALDGERVRAVRRLAYADDDQVE